MKRSIVFIIVFLCIIFFFMPSLFLLKEAFLHGDYLCQFYPWSKLYSETLKNFHFPFWSRYCHSGFPLMAEGQVGGFYPLNVLFFFLLPFPVAYNYSVIVHFLLAGIFMFAYVRRMGADRWGGTVAAVAFCFGSAYAGCFYNTVSLKTAAWIPLVLLLFEHYFASKRLRYAIGAGCIIGMQFLSGFVQIAFYSTIFYVIYYAAGLISRRNLQGKDAWSLLVVGMIAGCLFLPQYIITRQLVDVSGRAQAALGFALWGSFSPLNFLSLVFPRTIVSGTQFYIGVFTLFFLVVACMKLYRTGSIRPLFLVLFTAVFLALGAYNPLYVFLIKAAHLYGLRNPSKFILFGVFSASALSGLGFTRFFSTQERDQFKPSGTFFSAVLAAFLLVFFAGKAIIVYFKDEILAMGRWYVQRFIYGQKHHQFDLETYYDKIDQMYAQVLKHTSLSDIYLGASLALCCMSLVFVAYLCRKKRAGIGLKSIVVLFIVADLYIFSFYGTGFRGNLKPFSELTRNPSPKILAFLHGDTSHFRILPFGLSDEQMPWWLRPNANSLVQIDSVAAYSPLVSAAYKAKLAGLEVVDDSLGIRQPLPDAILARLEILYLLNVKYIVSTRQLRHDFLDGILQEDGIYLYRLRNSLARCFFAPSITPIDRDATRDVSAISYSDGLVTVDIYAPDDGYVVLSEWSFPGWHAFVDRLPAALVSVDGILQGVAVKKGRHQVDFVYEPFTHE